MTSRINDSVVVSRPSVSEYRCRSLVPVLVRTAKMGNPKQTKHAIRCISVVCKNKEPILAQVFEVSVYGSWRQRREKCLVKKLNHWTLYHGHFPVCGTYACSDPFNSFCFCSSKSLKYNF